jgi:hypothetical protein
MIWVSVGKPIQGLREAQATLSPGQRLVDVVRLKYDKKTYLYIKIKYT